MADRHGSPAPVDLATWLGDDPHLALVTADMGEWLAAQPPCECEGLCRCDAGPTSEAKDE